MLADEGVKLTDDVKGYVMFRQANLSQMQEGQITTWTQGSYERGTVIKALRKLEKVQKEKSGKHYATYDDASEGDAAADEDDSEEFVYFGDDDLQQVYDTMSRARSKKHWRHTKDQKVNRG